MSGRRDFLRAATGSMAAGALSPIDATVADQGQPPLAPEASADAAILAACARFMAITADVDRLNAAPDCDDDELTETMRAWNEAREVVTGTPACTLEGVRAKAQASIAVFRLDVPYIDKATDDAHAEPHERLAWSLTHDIAG